MIYNNLFCMCLCSLPKRMITVLSCFRTYLNIRNVISVRHIAMHEIPQPIYDIIANAILSASLSDPPVPYTS